MYIMQKCEYIAYALYSQLKILICNRESFSQSVSQFHKNCESLFVSLIHIDICVYTWISISIYNIYTWIFWFGCKNFDVILIWLRWLFKVKKSHWLFAISTLTSQCPLSDVIILLYAASLNRKIIAEQIYTVI